MCTFSNDLTTAYQCTCAACTQEQHCAVPNNKKLSSERLLQPVTIRSERRFKGETQRSLVCDHQLPIWCTNGNFCKVKQVPEQQTAESLAKVLRAAGEHWGLNRKRTAWLHGNASIMVGVLGLVSFKKGSKESLYVTQPIYCVQN